MDQRRHSVLAASLNCWWCCCTRDNIHNKKTPGGGIKDPLEIAVLPSKRGLGAAGHKTHKAAGTGATSSKHHGKKKVSRRQRQRLRAAEARNAAKAGDRQRQARLEAATGEQGLFAFINDSLGHGSEAAAKLQAAGVYGPDDGVAAAGGGAGGGGNRPRQQTGGGAALAVAAAAAAGGGGGGGGSGGPRQQQQQQQSQKVDDRKGLVGSQDGLAELKVGGLWCGSGSWLVCQLSVLQLVYVYLRLTLFSVLCSPLPRNTLLSLPFQSTKPNNNRAA